MVLAACKFPPEDAPPATESPATEPPPTQAPSTEVSAEPEATEAPAPEPCFSLLEPLDKTEFGKRGRITFVWEAQKGASSYKLIITLPNDLVEEYETELTRFEKYLESLPLTGEYHWQVTALNDALEEICISEIFTFTKVAPQKSGGGGGGGSRGKGVTTGETAGDDQE